MKVAIHTGSRIRIRINGNTVVLANDSFNMVPDPDRSRKIEFFIKLWTESHAFEPSVRYSDSYDLLPTLGGPSLAETLFEYKLIDLPKKDDYQELLKEMEKKGMGPEFLAKCEALGNTGELV